MAEPWGVPPCPHCGGEQVVNDYYPPDAVPVRRVVCPACGAFTYTAAPDRPRPPR